MSPYTISPDLNGEGLHIGIVRARFNETVGLTQLDSCLLELQELGVDERDIMIVAVPGALELGITLAQMAKTLEFDVLIALGAVIRGETYHFELVSNESAAAITRVSLETGIPVINGVLTTEDQAQADERASGKGRDCAQVAVEMANLMAALEPEVEDDDEDGGEEGEDDDDDDDDNNNTR